MGKEEKKREYITDLEKSIKKLMEIQKTGVQKQEWGEERERKNWNEIQKNREKKLKWNWEE